MRLPAADEQRAPNASYARIHIRQRIPGSWAVACEQAGFNRRERCMRRALAFRRVSLGERPGSAFHTA